MLKRALLMTVIIIFCVRSVFGSSFEGIEDRIRNSDAIITAEITKIIEGGVMIKVGEVIKGDKSVKNIKRLGGDIFNEGNNNLFKVKEKVILFIGEIHDDIGVLYGQEKGKLPFNPSEFKGYKSSISLLIEIDKSENKAKKTELLKKLIASSEIGKYIGLGEIYLRSNDYNIEGLKGIVKPLLSSKNPEIKKRAIMAFCRIFDVKAKGYSRDKELMQELVKALEDPSKDVYTNAITQLRNRTKTDMGFDPESDNKEKNKKAIERWKNWIKEGMPEKTLETEFEE
ncbi:MAG: hypothetical protein N2746_00355 [Deltaproteobacteria bacterium]|nr:hypothetical protein [Deltaproteobacteria bacterium]